VGGAWLALRFVLPGLAPFLLAYLFAALMEPLVRLLRRLHLSRAAASAVVTLGLLALLLFLMARLLTRGFAALNALAAELPGLLSAWEQRLSALEQWLLGLAAEIPGAEVTGVDISPEALTVARGQQVACHRAPSFVQADILQDPPASLPEASFDLLTANPPYVMDRERAAMRPNVLEHEPALALFVPDEDPLVFYRAVARWARTLLRPGGWGYAEINALLGPETAAVFRDAGFSGVSLLQDLGGASRFVRFFI
jgi:SAM-dependent methyltransferase